MRIAITHPYAWPEVRRGAERIVVETSRSLAARGHEVTVLTSGWTAANSCSGGIRTVRLRRRFTRGGLHERHFAAKVLPLLLSGRFEIVHSMMPWDAFAAIWARRLGGYKVVFDDMAVPFRAWERRPVGRARRRIVRDVDVYGCMSRFSVDVLREEWGREGSIIPGGVRLAQFATSDVREAAPTILFSGALAEPHKGLALLLEAVELLVDEFSGIQVWLSGPGDPAEILSGSPRRAVEKVTVLPLGEPEEQGERYARAWVTALPSTSEPFGLVLVESLASGTPIVVLDDATPPSLVTPGTGAIARPNDPASLAGALRQGFVLAREPATAARCRTFAAGFDWDARIAPILENLYESVL